MVEIGIMNNKGYFKIESIGLIPLLAIVFTLLGLGFPVIQVIVRDVGDIIKNLAEIVIKIISGIENFLSNLLYYMDHMRLFPLNESAVMIFITLLVALWTWGRFRRYANVDCSDLTKYQISQKLNFSLGLEQPLIKILKNQSLIKSMK